MADGRRMDWSLRRAQVEELVLRHERDGVAYKQLAIELKLPLPTLYAWTQRLKRERAEPSASASASRAGFVELQAAGGAHDSGFGGVELVLTSGLRIRLDASFHESTLKRLLMTLGA